MGGGLKKKGGGCKSYNALLYFISIATVFVYIYKNMNDKTFSYRPLLCTNMVLGQSKYDEKDV